MDASACIKAARQRLCQCGELVSLGFYVTLRIVTATEMANSRSTEQKLRMGRGRGCGNRHEPYRSQSPQNALGTDSRARSSFRHRRRSPGSSPTRQKEKECRVLNRCSAV